MIFNFAPATDRQNIELTYSYGETNSILSRLAKYMCALEVIMRRMGKTAFTTGTYTGVNMEQLFIAENRHIAQLRRMMEVINEDLKNMLGGNTRVDVG